MEVQFAVVAEYVNKTERGNLNICGIFNELHALTFPVKHRSLTTVVRLRYDPVDALQPIQLALGIVDVDGKPIFEVRGPTQLMPTTADGGFADHMVQFNDLVFERPGRYSIDTTINGVIVARIPLHVRQILPDGTAAQGGA